MSDPELSDEQREFAETICRLAQETIHVSWSVESAERFVDVLTRARVELDHELVDYGIWLVFVCSTLQRLPTPREAAAMGIGTEEYKALIGSIPPEYWPIVEPRGRVLH